MNEIETLQKLTWITDYFGTPRLVMWTIRSWPHNHAVTRSFALARLLMAVMVVGSVPWAGCRSN